jgi:hypothetical protein
MAFLLPFSVVLFLWRRMQFVYFYYCFLSVLLRSLTFFFSCFLSFFLLLYLMLYTLLLVYFAHVIGVLIDERRLGQSAANGS